MPRIEYKDRVEWLDDDWKYHRLDDPAVEWTNGTKVWCAEGKCHRLNGPAIVRADGTKEWWVDGNWHRLDGPAIERADGTKEWWVRGICVCNNMLTIDAIEQNIGVLTLLEVASLMKFAER